MPSDAVGGLGTGGGDICCWGWRLTQWIMWFILVLTCTPCLGGFTFRLKRLLDHTNILRPHYQCVEGFVNIWQSNREISAALQDPVILQATCPYNPAGNGSS